MSKSSKVMIAIMLVVLTACAAAIGIVSVVKSKEGNQVITDVNGNTAIVIGNETTTTQPPVVTGLKTDILGKWSDSSGMMGYEFFENGTCNVTYVNLTVPVVNIPINGTAKGTYNISGDVVTVNFSIYSGNIKRVYTAKVSGTSLLLTDHSNGKVTSMMKDGSSQPVIPSSSSSGNQTGIAGTESNTILGMWKSTDNSIEYNFRENGTISIKYFNNNTSSEFSGVYLINNDEITLQYTSNGQLVTKKFKYNVTGTSLTITDANNTSTLFIRSGVDSIKLLGKWADSSGMSGYQFNNDGTVKVTYVNLTVPVVNIPITGTFNGSYSISGDVIKITYSIYSNSVSNEYRFTVNESSLTLVNQENGDVTSYIRQN